MLVRLIRNTKQACAISRARDIAGATSDEVDDDGGDDNYGSERRCRRWRWCDGRRHSGIAMTAMMVAGDDDNDVNEDGAMGNEVNDIY